MREMIVIAGGGTGGHIFPALSLRTALQEKDCPVFFVTDQRGSQYASGDLILIVRHRVRIKLAMDLFRNVFKCLLLFLKSRPACVVSFGGYAAFAPMAAAQLLRIPTYLHEQNAVLGRVNRLNAHFVKVIATAFPEVKGVPKRKLFYVGSPVRPAIAALSERIYVPPKDSEPFRLLIVGGSQGARVFSEVVPEALALLSSEERGRLHVFQQCRPEWLETTALRYQKLGLNAVVKPFFSDMETLYRKAHLVITRSGASTIAEVAIAGLPAIFVPYPYAADAHQQRNAVQLEQAGASWMILEPDFTPRHLYERLQIIFSNPLILKEKSEKVRQFATPQAGQVLANFIAGSVEKRHN